MTGCKTVSIEQEHEQDKSGRPGDQGKAPLRRNLENT